VLHVEPVGQVQVLPGSGLQGGLACAHGVDDFANRVGDELRIVLVHGDGWGGEMNRFVAAKEGFVLL
jgi:hypothetical protein